MKSGITRWKVVLSYAGLASVAPVLGLRQGFSPAASPTKLATVLGAFLASSLTMNGPSLVWKVAHRSLPASAFWVHFPCAPAAAPASALAAGAPAARANETISVETSMAASYPRQSPTPDQSVVGG